MEYVAYQMKTVIAIRWRVNWLINEAGEWLILQFCISPHVTSIKMHQEN